MPELLTGTVTFVFTDIEGSTRLVRSQGAGWGALLDRHHALLRDAWMAHGGVEVGTEGDSFFVTFASAAEAVAAAVDVQRSLAAEGWPPDATVRVRVGMHTGEASFSADTYAGINVHRAARIAGAAHGGQVLLSEATHALVAGELPSGVGARDMGDHRLKDLEHPEHLWQLVIDGLDNEFPAISSFDATPNNLPNRLTTFLGREREIAEVAALLVDARLLTLTGPGGTGKTRLSLEVATDALRHYPDGVFFVELTTLTEPDLVLPTIAQVLNLPDRGGSTPLERLTDHIGTRAMLLVLDNFEQVADAATSLGPLLVRCPNLKLIVSSRIVLNVAGEREYLVPPLRLPDPARLPPLAELARYESVALFVERARAIRPGFELTDANAPAVAEICARLDGLPLAIELAAARIRVLTPQAMLGRLTDRLGLLQGGSRDLPARQQTLRGAIEWSHDMLDEPDRVLFACLSVFNGGATIEAVERVCAEGGADVIDRLASLVEKSLVQQREGVGGEPRFVMLETIREYAQERAAALGRLAHLRVAHAAAFAEMAARAGPLVMTADKRRWLDRLEEEHDNLRAAMAWAIEAGSAAVALRMGASLWRFWQMRGYLVEGLERVTAALRLPDAHDHPAERADALSAAAGLAYWLGDQAMAREYYTAEVSLRRELGDRAGLAEALYGLSFTWTVMGGLSDSETAAASEMINQALAIFTELDDRLGIGRTEWALANLAWATDSDPARVHAENALAAFEAVGDTFMVAWAGYTIGLAALKEHQSSETPDPALLEEAAGRFRRALRIFEEAGDVTGYALLFDALSIVAERSGDRQRAARIAGAAATIERKSGTGLNPWNREVLAFDPKTLHDDPLTGEAWAEGERMLVTDAVAYALEA
ncbi:MAG: adenylate/guanylate cyclase domain-containing protein [Chloroflexi bacterium]|nr:adenylate/guanylate cyclase domain-containing protein [Chloroflexota bacterium]